MSTLDWAQRSVKLLAAEREAFDSYQAAWNRSNKANATADDKAVALAAHDRWVEARTPLDELMKKMKIRDNN